MTYSSQAWEPNTTGEGEIHCNIPYNRKYWRSIKFGSLAVGEATVNVKFIYLRMRAYYMYGRGEVPLNLNPPILLFGPLRTKLPIFFRLCSQVFTESVMLEGGN